MQQDSNTVTSDKITFDMENEQLVAQGNHSENGRVTTIFNPESFPTKKQTDKDQQKEPQQ